MTVWQKNSIKKVVWFVPFETQTTNFMSTSTSFWRNKVFVTFVTAILILLGGMLAALCLQTFIGHFVRRGHHQMSKEEPKLLVSHNRSICELHDEDCYIRIETNSAITGINYYYPQDIILWAEENNILMVSSDPIEDRIELPEASLIDFAVDFINDKIYILDQLRLTIYAIDMFGPKYRSNVIGGKSLTKPQHIALDPYERLMFITDDHRILRADMDGSNLHVIVDVIRNKIAFTRGWSDVAVDLGTKHVYSINEDYDQVERFTYDGNNRILIKSTKSWRFHNINIFNSVLYWTDAANNNSIMTISINETGGALEPMIINATNNIIHFKLIPPTSGGSKNACSTAKCEQSCLISNSILGYRCACDIGYEIAANGRNCTLMDNFFLYADNNLIKFKSFNGTELYNPVLASNSNQRFNAITSFAFDSINRLVFHSDKFGNIYRSRIINYHQDILYRCNNVCNVKLAYDWIAQNLYFIDKYSKTLGVVKTVGMIRPLKILLQNLDNLEDVAVDPIAGYVFFSQSGNLGGINRVYADGTHLSDFEKIRVSQPSLLTVDSVNKKLWWYDTEHRIIECSNYDGSRRVQMNLSAIKGDNIELIDKYRYKSPFVFESDYQTVARIISRDDNTINNFHFFNDSSFENLKVFGIKFQPRKHNHPCFADPCLGFCFAVPDNTDLESTKLYKSCVI